MIGMSNTNTAFFVASYPVGLTSPYLYDIARTFIAFDTTGVSGATSAKIKVTITSNTITEISKSFTITKTATLLPANHTWSTTDFIATGDPGANDEVVSPISVLRDYTGEIEFNLNSVGLDYINNNDSASFVMLSYENDYISFPSPDTNFQELWGDINSVKLIYS